MAADELSGMVTGVKIQDVDKAMDALGSTLRLLQSDLGIEEVSVASMNSSSGYLLSIEGKEAVAPAVDAAVGTSHAKSQAEKDPEKRLIFARLSLAQPQEGKISWILSTTPDFKPPATSGEEFFRKVVDRTLRKVGQGLAKQS